MGAGTKGERGQQAKTRRRFGPLDQGWAAVIAAIVTVVGTGALIYLPRSDTATTVASEPTRLEDLLGRWENRGTTPYMVVQLTLESPARLRLTRLTLPPMSATSPPALLAPTFLDLTVVGANKFSGTMTMTMPNGSSTVYGTDAELSEGGTVLTMTDRPTPTSALTTVLHRVTR